MWGASNDGLHCLSDGATVHVICGGAHRTVDRAEYLLLHICCGVVTWLHLLSRVNLTAHIVLHFRSRLLLICCHILLLLGQLLGFELIGLLLLTLHFLSEPLLLVECNLAVNTGYELAV